MHAFGTESLESVGRRRTPAADTRWRLWALRPLWIAVHIAAVALMTVPAWILGGVRAEVQFWLFVVGACATLGCWSICLARSVSLRPLPVALVPLALALVLAALQTIPLPPTVHRWFSPRTQRWWQDLAPHAATDSEPADNGGYPLSLYPASTRREGDLLALAVAAFTLAAIVLANRTAFAIAGVAVAINGAALAFFGLAQQLTRYGGLFPPVGVGTPFASFVNRNNAAGFLNMCLACGIAISVWGIVHRTYRRPKRRPADELDSFHADRQGSRLQQICLSIPRTLGNNALLVLARLNSATLGGLLAAACIAAGIFCSLSRGGTIAMLGAAIITLLAAALAGRWRLAWLAPMFIAGLAACLLVGYVGKGDSVKQRLATLLDESTLQGDGRLVNWADGKLAAQDLLPAGSGLGTYRYVYRLYQQQPNSAWFYHAENQYLQTLVEAGLAGLALLLAALGLVALACWRLLRHAPDPTTYALGVAGTFAVSSQAISAAFDFGLYLPANMLLLAAICGAVCGRAARTEKKVSGTVCRNGPQGALHKRFLTPFSLASLFCRNGPEGALHKEKKVSGTVCRNGPEGAAHKRFLTPFSLCALPRLRPLAASCCVALSGLLLLAGGEARRAAAVAAALRQVQPLDLRRSQSVEALDGCLARFAVASPDGVQDVEAQWKLAQLWINRMRVGLVAIIRQDVPDDTSDSVIWTATDTVQLYGRAQQWTAQQQSAPLAALRTAPPVLENLPSAIWHLQRARRLCPLLPEIHLMLAQLAPLTAAGADNRADLQRARLVAPAQPAILTRCGLLELQAGRIALACRCWRTSLALNPKQLPEILRVARPEMDLVEHLGELLPDSPQWILDVALAQFGAEADRPIRDAALGQADRLAAARPGDDAQARWLRGRIAMLQDQPLLAVQRFTQAVEIRPNETAWRYDLAVALQRLERYAEAQEQARICALAEPNNEQYDALLRDVIRAQLAPNRRATSRQE